MADKKISALTAATTPLDGTEVLPLVQGGATVKVANNDLRPKQIQSNATSGVLQVAGPAAAATRVMTTPDANFTAARTDAAQTFTGDQSFTNNVGVGGSASGTFPFIVQKSAAYNAFFNNTNATGSGPLIYAASTASQDALTVATYDGGKYLFRVRGDGQIFWYDGNINQSTAAKGVNFTANTPAAGMTSQLLSWYEEGTWTPVASRGDVGSAGSAITATYTLQVGKYTRVGSLVTVSALILISSISAQGTGNNFISGLPFTPVNNSLGAGAVARNDAFTTSVVTGCFEWADAKIFFVDNTNSSSAVTTDWKSGYVNFTLSYFV